jgi:hypothetical protein
MSLDFFRSFSSLTQPSRFFSHIGAAVLVALSLGGCAPERESFTDADLKRILDRVAEDRLVQNLQISSGESKKRSSDLELFREACKIYRISPESALERLKVSNPEAYQAVLGNANESNP